MRRLVGLGLVLSTILAAGALALAGAAEMKAEEAKVTGELVDTFCFATMGAKGDSHKKCAMACAKKGIPVGILEANSDKVHVLLPAKDKGTLPDEVMNKMGETVTVSGSKYAAGGTSFLVVESVK